MLQNSRSDDVIRTKIAQAVNIGIVSHIRPDGDAIGATLGLGLALMQAGKKVQMVLKDGISPTFHHLAGVSMVKRKLESECDLVIVLDCSDLARTGGVLKDRKPDINIDHHVTNENFAGVNLVEDGAVATSAILTSHIPHWGLEIDVDVARALLTGILSDSIGFRTSNTTAESLRLAAVLVDKGANINELYNKALLSRSYEATKYWGFALSRLQREGGLVWTSLTLDDRKASGYFGNDDADLTNILSSIDSFEVAVLFVEQSAEKTKVSWRFSGDLDIAELAHQLGGGGHPAAAGAELRGTLAEIQENILDITRIYLSQSKSML
jgi:phosphoesterase RecJ-like protein